MLEEPAKMGNSLAAIVEGSLSEGSEDIIVEKGVAGANWMGSCLSGNLNQILDRQ